MKKPDASIRFMSSSLYTWAVPTFKREEGYHWTKRHVTKAKKAQEGQIFNTENAMLLEIQLKALLDVDHLLLLFVVKMWFSKVVRLNSFPPSTFLFPPRLSLHLHHHHRLHQQSLQLFPNLVGLLRHLSPKLLTSTGPIIWHL